MKKTVTDKTFDIRPLTRGEIKTLRQRGLNIANLSPDNADDAIDAVLEMALGAQAAEIDGLPNSAALELFKAIVEETYSVGESAKNS